MSKIKNTTGHKTGSYAMKLKTHAVLFALLHTMSDYQLTCRGMTGISLWVKVMNHETTFTAKNLYDLPQQLGDWVVSLPKDVWTAHGEVLGILNSTPKL